MSTQPTIAKLHRHQDEIPYDMIARAVVQTLTNPDSLAIWVYLQSKPQNWVVRESDIRKHFSLGRTRYLAAMKALRVAGLYEVTREKNEAGQIVGSAFHVYASPHVRVSTRMETDTCIKENETSTEEEKNTEGERRTESVGTSEPSGKPKASGKSVCTHSKTKKPRKLTIDQWLDGIGDDDPVREGDPIYRYAELAGIPEAYLAIGWVLFEERMRDTGKTYTDFRAAYRNYVKAGYLGAWAIDRDGDYYLTTAGKQAQAALDARGGAA